MDYILQIKSFSDLSREEQKQLKDLVIPDGIEPIWLRDTDGYLDRYASLAKVEDIIVGWAAVDIGDDGLSGVGAFIRPEYRGRGIAKSCINQVLSHAHSKLKKGKTCFLMYDQGFKELFKPAIETNGFFPSSATLVYHG